MNANQRNASNNQVFCFIVVYTFIRKWAKNKDNSICSDEVNILNKECQLLPLLEKNENSYDPIVRFFNMTKVKIHRKHFFVEVTEFRHRPK